MLMYLFILIHTYIYNIQIVAQIVQPYKHQSWIFFKSQFKSESQILSENSQLCF